MSELEPGAAPSLPRWAIGVLVAALLCAALDGAVLAGSRLHLLPGFAPRVSALPPAVGQSVPTSFGDLVVQTVVARPGEALSALAVDEVRGVSAARGDVWVEVSAAVTNLTNRPRPYGADRFRLLLGRTGLALAPARTSPAETSLFPVSSGERLLAFLVAESHPDLWLQFDDPGSARPVLLDLGRVGQLPNHAGTGPGHDEPANDPGQP